MKKYLIIMALAFLVCSLVGCSKQDFAECDAYVNKISGLYNIIESLNNNWAIIQFFPISWAAIIFSKLGRSS